MDRSGLIVLIICALLFQAVVLAEEIHQVQNVRLLDHVVPEYLNVGPMRVDGDLLFRQVLKVHVRQVEITGMLFKTPVRSSLGIRIFSAIVFHCPGSSGFRFVWVMAC